MAALEIGEYVNLFPVTFDRTHFRVAKTERGRYLSLEDFRKELKICSVYAIEDRLYGFGSSLEELTLLGFTESEVAIEEVPKLTTAIMKEGLFQHIARLGYEAKHGFSDRAYDHSNPLPVSVKEVKLFRGFEFRPIYLFDELRKRIFFSLLVDLKYKLEIESNPVSFGQVNQYVTDKYGEGLAHQTIMDIRSMTGDLTPFGQRNPEASRFRLGKILQFVSEFKEATLFDGSGMHVSQEPIRIAGGAY